MKFGVRVIIASILLAPVFASAQSTSDLTSQAETLLKQIQQLQAQLGGGSATGGVAGACYSGGPLKPGASGASVSALQQFLAADPSVYPEAKVTGYYGALTQKAVQRFQVKNDIVTSGTPSTTGYGSVGPRTVAVMAAACGGASDSSGDPVVGGFIKVSPVEGSAPLTVNVEVTINTVKSCLPATYSLSWGDNSLPFTISVPAGKCDVVAQTYTHLYTLGGEYNVTLSSGQHQTTSKVTVSGNGSIMTSGTMDTNFAGGSASTGGSTTGGSSTGGSSTGGQVVSGALAISMSSNSFSPGNITVTSGTRVTWTNTDSMPHTVTADNGSYNSGAMSPGQTYALTFTAKGEYTYYCAIHGAKGGIGMSGKITVQ
jgi:plastocyanin